VDAFDPHRGVGEVVADDGVRYGFHCTAIVDGSRVIAVGSTVEFAVVPGVLGGWEASAITPARPDAS
jgi:cold shock CspA family protein